MSLVKENIRSIKNFEKEIESIARKSILKNSEYILNLLKDGQLRKSIMSDGGLAPFYSENTIAYAYSDRPVTGVESKDSSNRFNFEWSGSWMEQIYIRIESGDDGFNILSSDGKTKILEEMSGGKITALTKENNEIINNEIIKPALYEKLFDALLYF